MSSEPSSGSTVTGTSDGDGLQEYATRSSHGYYNQGWKDAEDAVLDANGVKAPLPIALCEHQGYVVAAKRAWADVLESALGDDRAARRLRSEADHLAELIEERFWWEAEGTYYLGLDGEKRPIETVASNPAHLLVGRGHRPRAGAAGRPTTARAGHVQRLGHPHPRLLPQGLQSLRLPPRDGLAARQRHRRRGVAPLRPRRGGGAGGGRHLRRRAAFCRLPAAGAVRRACSRRGWVSRSLPRCQRSPGVGVWCGRPPHHDLARTVGRRHQASGHRGPVPARVAATRSVSRTCGSTMLRSISG